MQNQLFLECVANDDIDSAKRIIENRLDPTELFIKLLKDCKYKYAKLLVDLVTTESITDDVTLLWVECIANQDKEGMELLRKLQFILNPYEDISQKCGKQGIPYQQVTEALDGEDCEISYMTGVIRGDHVQHFNNEVPINGIYYLIGKHGALKIMGAEGYFGSKLRQYFYGALDYYNDTTLEHLVKEGFTEQCNEILKEYIQACSTTANKLKFCFKHGLTLTKESWDWLAIEKPSIYQELQEQV